MPSGQSPSLRTRAINCRHATRLTRMNHDFFSARRRATLARHQRQVTVCLKSMQSADRLVIGALSACDASGQRESVETYLESIQELRVSLQRLEAFLLQRLLRPENDATLLDSSLDAADA